MTRHGEKACVYGLRGRGGLCLEVTDYGCKVNRLLVPDRAGRLVDVAVGFDSVKGWDETDPYFGAIVGRYASYIANGRFTLDGREYVLAKNDSEHDTHLHGGTRGWNDYVWNAKPFQHENGDVGIVFSRASADGEEGYPGRMEVKVVYTVTPDNVWRIDYEATTDKPTPVNLTQHTLFDLNGRGTGLDQLLWVSASKYSPIDSHFTPVGRGRPVEATPFDFRVFRRIGERIDAPDAMLQLGPGYDHNWELDGSGFRKVAELRGETRAMEVWTDQIGLQVYAGNCIKEGWRMKGGRTICRRGWIALETQHFPDSPNRADYPSTILRPGEVYRTRTEYRFKALTDAHLPYLVDRVADSDRYASLNPGFPKAFAFMKRVDLHSLKAGRHEIDGDVCWAIVEDTRLKPSAPSMRYEVHHDYIDIHVPITGPETYGVKVSDLGNAPYDNKEDCRLATAEGVNVTLVPGEFAVFFPEDGAHAPEHTLGPTDRPHRKLIIKVKSQPKEKTNEHQSS